MLPEPTDTKQKPSSIKEHWRDNKLWLEFLGQTPCGTEHKICPEKCKFTQKGTECAGPTAVSKLPQWTGDFLSIPFPMKEISAPLTRFYLELWTRQNVIEKMCSRHICVTTYR